MHAGDRVSARILTPVGVRRKICYILHISRSLPRVIRGSSGVPSPDLIQFAPGLPKTRSGKIMRRILRKIAEDESGALGDTSTLADPAVVTDLVNNRQNKKSA